MFERMFVDECAALCLSLQACVGVQMLLQKEKASCLYNIQV